VFEKFRTSLEQILTWSNVNFKGFPEERFLNPPPPPLHRATVDVSLYQNWTATFRTLAKSLVALCPNAPYFIILLCLMLDNFQLVKGRALVGEHWWESTDGRALMREHWCSMGQSDYLLMCLVNPTIKLHCTLMCPTLFYSVQHHITRQGEREPGAQWVKNISCS
jgi:hypothetical protein